MLALIAVSLLMFGFTCGKDDPDTDAVDVTDPPTKTPSVEAIADFQLVGRIDEAFAGQDPPVEVDAADLTAPTTAAPSVDPASTAAASPTGSPVGETPTRGGIIRLEIEDLSQDLIDACGLAQDDVVHIYWTTSTAFDPASVLDDVEDQIEDRTAGVVGTILRIDDGDAAISSPEATAGTATTTPFLSTTGSPSVSATPQATVEAGDCLLVAEQVLMTTTVLPTPRPRAATRTASPTPAARTASPTPERTATPTPEETDEPTEPPETEEPTEEPSASP
jgi:hypothetical protein